MCSMAKGVLEVAHIFGWVKQERGAKKTGERSKNLMYWKKGVRATVEN